MAGETISVKGVLADFPAPILPNIDGEPTREVLVDLHQLINGNEASVALNLVGDRHRNLAVKMRANDYRAQTGSVFVPPHNPGEYPQSMGSAQ